MNNHLQYLIHLGDNALILGHRLSEWCGHGPVLEQDIALTNIALDLIGQARNLYQHAGVIEGKGRTEDDIAYLRKILEYRNVLLVEQPNGNFGKTIMRQFLYDAYNFHHYTALTQSADMQLRAIAQKSIKEITYHLRFSSEWVIRLGDGTEESHQKMQEALDDLWMYKGELTEMTSFETELSKTGIATDLSAIKSAIEQTINETLVAATLTAPEGTWSQTGGKEGKHSEHLGFVLAELQYMQRAYPGMEW